MGNTISKRKSDLLTDEEMDQLFNQMVANGLIPGLSFNLMIMGRAFVTQLGFWKPLIRCIAASENGDQDAREILARLEDLADRFFPYLLSNEGGRNEIGYRRWSDSWGNEWSQCASRLTDWHARRTGGAKAWATKSPIHMLPETLSFVINGIHSAVVAAFSTADQWGVTPTGLFSRGAFWHTDHLDLGVTVGMGQNGQPPMHWDYLRTNGPRMVKAHYALWAHWKERGAGGHVRVSFNQFCHDQGYQKHHNGGFRPRDRQKAIKTLHTLEAIEIEVSFAPTSGRQRRLNGPLWNLGMIAKPEENHPSNEGWWEPEGFSYAPGDWFRDADWSAYNRQIGKIGAGLLGLGTYNDRWAILITGYIGTLMWPGRTSVKLRVSTILKRTGLAQDKESYRRASETRASFERSLSRLREQFIITQYSQGEHASELSDPDDPDEVDDYFHEALKPANEWRKQLIEFEIDTKKNAAALRASRLEDAAE